jgi:hypothetical protein
MPYRHDYTHWPVSRYIREVVPSQPHGRLLIFFAKVNLCVGLLLALSLSFFPLMEHVAWSHVVIFLCTPLVGFIMFMRDMTFDTRQWQRVLSGLVQLVFALLPWGILIRDHVR